MLASFHFYKEQRMKIQDQIIQDMKSAMKKGETLKLETLRTIRAHFIELSKRGSEKPISADDELTVVLSAMKKRKEAIDMYLKAGRNDLAHKETQELEIIKMYLPKQMSQEEAETIIVKLIKECGAQSAKEFGKVMSLAMKELKGKIDGKIIQEIVKKNLTEEEHGT